ncbi:DNA polymerase III subunit epsilon [Sphingomonas morindae]|uniref:DNA polymerase III subunit epsilon n=1 Tax=Sphingomonas morindae TaxID=1541170 RepID=A0ABY4XBW1_9SPHN|nr:DNA polymerase III subunit epsilon [Sphingomonas morindae]USI74241.1 DNA polymerase III subunit epsilon [Sphingomonas morindae]
MREIVFDTETTGLSPADGHRLVEIGCVEIINRVETGRSFHAYFHPERDMPVEAERVHGLSLAFLSDKPRFGEGAAALLDFLGEAPLVAHNASFDFGFLNWELNACGHPPIAMHRMVDTLAIARARHPGAKHSLDALCTRYGIDRSHRVKHGALLDAQLLAQLYVELMGGRQIGLGLAEAAPILVETDEAAVLAAAPAREARPPRRFQPSADEMERHRAFVATLSNPVWARYAPAG